jgi:CIC family chloride channel protein
VFLPLLVGSVIAHLFTVLTLKRSILTEKVARRGFHLSREYAVDPLELLFVREVMATSILSLPESTILDNGVDSERWRQLQAQRLVPIVDGDKRLLGVVTSDDVLKWKDECREAGSARTLGELARTDTISVYSDETLRVIVYRMAESGLTRMPVVDRQSGKLEGMVTLEGLLKARTRHLEDERHREQTLGWGNFTGSRAESSKADS